MPDKSEKKDKVWKVWDLCYVGVIFQIYANLTESVVVKRTTQITSFFES